MAGQNHHNKILNLIIHCTNTISLDPVRLARQECHQITRLDLKLHVFCEDASPTLKGINNETFHRVEITCTRKLLFLNTEDFKLFCIILKSHPNNMQPEKHVFLAISLPSHPGQENPRNFVPMSGMDKAKGIRSPICIIPFLSLLMVH